MRPTAPVQETEAGPLVRRTREGPVQRITLANPPANALSLAVMDGIQQALEDAREDRSVRVIVVAGAGSVFCAGHDLKEMTAHRSDEDRGRAFFAETMSVCAHMMQTIVRHPKPVIAEVAGVATAAGCQLVASCDLAVASHDASFATPGVDIGLFCSTPMVALSRNVSRKHAMQMLLTGEAIDAATAVEFGLINKVVLADSLYEETMRLAGQIASKSTATLKIGKEAFYQQAEMGLAEAYDHTARVMVENMLARDAEEGINAFIEKREPSWSDE